ncbi:MAG TPA: HipA domain-containing protein [Longimicrobiales bacterium]|nr:HipA domain-containing protein [Longimicrobiales bacterium]
MRPLDELRQVERAAVLKRGTRAATLQRRPDAVVFSYEADHVASGGDPVATTLPLSLEPLLTHAPGALPPFFSGLLPEGRRLSALRSAVKTSADDEFTLLLAVGADAVGDVQVVPEGEDPAVVEPRVSTADWGSLRFAELFTASVGGAASIDRVALPGVQEKASARMISVPAARANERFLLKLDPPEFPHLVANEAFFLEAARRSGLPSADAEVVRDAVGAMGLLVRRFDRIGDAEGQPLMLAQEDACQALARYPADKYRLSVEQVIQALAAVCQAAPVAALTLLRQVAFAYLTCNGDAHAKNFSVLRLADGEWRVTPAYDVPSSYPYGDTSMALPVNGRHREDIGRADFLALGAHVGLRPRAVERALDELCERADLWIGDMDQLPFDERVLHKLHRAVEYRRERVRRR